MTRSGQTSKRLWRPLISVLLAYALAVQSLLIAFAGVAAAAPATDDPAFVLCLHDEPSAPSRPADIPDHSACTHCILCFAGAQLAIVGAAPALRHHRIVSLAPAAVTVTRGAPARHRYVIASPRGPPSKA